MNRPVERVRERLLGRRTPRKPGENAYAVYLAGAAGAFLIGFGDIIKNGGDTTHVTVLRIADVLKTYFSPVLGQGWVALTLLTLLGALLCWVRRPPARADGFALGLSVFAVLTALAPAGPPTRDVAATAPRISKVASALSPVAVAVASTEEPTAVLWPYYFRVREEDGSLHGSAVHFSLYDKNESSRIVMPGETASESVRTVVPGQAGGDTVRFNLPVGAYVLYVECDRCSRTRIDFNVEPKMQASDVIVRGSSIPLGLQRLFRPGATAVRDLPDREAARIASDYRGR